MRRSPEESHGQLSPIVAFAEGDHVQTIDGFKRLRAARALGWSSVAIMLAEVADGIDAKIKPARGAARAARAHRATEPSIIQQLQIHDVALANRAPSRADLYLKARQLALDPVAATRYNALMFPKYDALKVKTLKLISEGKLSSTPSREQCIDIAYGNAAIENDAITREMVAEAVDAKRR
jgi:hypothetical protein